MNRPDAINLYTMLLNVTRGEPFMGSKSAVSKAPKAPTLPSEPPKSGGWTHKDSGRVHKGQPIMVFSI